MSKKQRIISFVIFAALIILLMGGIILLRHGAEEESISEVMRNEVLHEIHKVNFFGMQVNPGLISAFTVSGIIIVFAVIVRIFVIPKFKIIPGKFQMFLEEIVNLFDKLAKSNSPHKNNFLGAYIFGAGVYIFVGTVFELFGFQVISIAGSSIALPAPLSDINGAIALGFLSYGIILGGGLVVNGIKGVGKTLKDFSLPISMSFRLFGALLSGALVTELVYYYMSLSFVVPVIVGVLFTLLHALIQAYVLTLLVSIFYGEVVEKHEKKPKKKKKKTEISEEIKNETI